MDGTTWQVEPLSIPPEVFNIAISDRYHRHISRYCMYVGDQLITFSSLRKRMSTVLMNNFNKKRGICYTKG